MGKYDNIMRTAVQINIDSIRAKLRREEDAKRERQFKAEADQEADAESQEECQCGSCRTHRFLTKCDDIPF